MRANLEDNLAKRLRHTGARFSTIEVTLTSDYIISREGSTFHFLNPGGVNRNVRMPPIDPAGGQLYLIINTATSGNLNIQTNLGAAIAVLPADRTAFLTSSTTIWKAAIIAESLVPETADYLVGTSTLGLVNGRIVTNTPTVTWDLSTPGIVKANTVSGGGNVSNSGIPTTGQLARWTDSTHIEGFTAAFQPLDPDLTAISTLTGTNTIYYRSAPDTWSPVTIGTNLTFASGTLSATGGGGGGNVSSSGTITVGQYAKWATATTIQSVAPATVLSDIGGAPLASPTFTGDPKAPTPATADSDTSIATTAYVQANLASFAPLLSPVFTGNPTAPTPLAGDNDASIATTAFVTAAIAAVSGSSSTTPSAPQGRLTLQMGKPVMDLSSTNNTVIRYEPYVGDRVPIFDGTNMVMTGFTSLSTLLSDTTKNPSAIGANKVNDWFVWNDAGTVRLSHGPDWTNDITRSAGTALVRVNGLWLNNVSITNACAAQRGTYVGTTRSNASSQFDWMLQAQGAGGSPLLLSIWNCYNRVDVEAVTRDTADHSLVAGQAFQGTATPNTNITFVSGLAEDVARGTYRCPIQIATGGNYAVIGISLDGATPVSGSAERVTTGYGASGIAVAGITAARADQLLGAHIYQAVEGTGTGGSSNPSFGGTYGTVDFILSGLHLSFKM